MIGLPRVSINEENQPQFVNSKIKPIVSQLSRTRSLSPPKLITNKSTLGSPRKTLIMTDTNRRRIMLERNDVRELNSKSIASINWVKHCHIKREQIPSKLRGCFLITKCEINSK